MANESQFDQGLEYYHLENFDEAIGKFENVEKNDKDYALALCFIGLSNFQKGNYNRSGFYFDKAITCFKDPTENGNAMKEGYLQFYKFLALIKLKQYSQADYYYNTTINTLPSISDRLFPLLWYNKGICVGMMENYEESIKYFDKVINSNSSNIIKADAIRNKCFAEFKDLFIKKNKNVKEFNEQCKNQIRKSFDSAINTYPNFSFLKNTLAYVLNVLGDYEESLKLVKEILKNDADLAGAYRNKCYANCMLGEYENYKEAEESINEAIKLDAKNAHAWNYKGYVLLQLAITDSEDESKEKKKIYLEESISCFQKAITLNNNYANAWNNKGVAILYLNENYDIAIGCFERATQIDKDSTESHNNLGYAKIRSMKVLDKNRIEESLEHFTTALESVSDLKSTVKADAYRNRGYAYGMLGIYDDAVKDFKDALKALKALNAIKPNSELGQKKLNSDISDTYRNLAFAQARRALELSNQIIESSKEEEEKYKEAISYLNDSEDNYIEAIKSDVNYALAYNSYGYFIIHKVKIYQELDERTKKYKYKTYIEGYERTKKYKYKTYIEGYKKAIEKFDEAIKIHSKPKRNSLQNKIAIFLIRIIIEVMQSTSWV